MNWAALNTIVLITPVYVLNQIAALEKLGRLDSSRRLGFLYKLLLLILFYQLFLLACLNFKVLIPTPFILKSLIFSDVLYEIQARAYSLSTQICFFLGSSSIILNMSHKLDNASLHWLFSYIYSTNLNSWLSGALSVIAGSCRIYGNAPVMDPMSFTGAYRLSEIFSLLHFFYSSLAGTYNLNLNSMLTISSQFAEHLSALRHNLDYIAPHHSLDLSDIESFSRGRLPSSGHLVVASMLHEGNSPLDFCFFKLFAGSNSALCFSRCLEITPDEISRLLLISMTRKLASI